MVDPPRKKLLPDPHPPAQHTAGALIRKSSLRGYSAKAASGWERTSQDVGYLMGNDHPTEKVKHCHHSATRAENRPLPSMTLRCQRENLSHIGSKDKMESHSELWPAMKLYALCDPSYDE